MKRLTLIMVIICFTALAIAAYAADEEQEAAKPKVHKIDLGEDAAPTGTIGYGEQAQEYESEDDVEGFGGPEDTANEAPIGKVPSE